MNGNDSFFMRMCAEAEEELASGKTSWRDVPSNVLILAAFGMLSNHLASRIVRPLWLFAGTVFAAGAAFILDMLTSRGV